MFLLYQEVYVLMELAVNLWNKDLYWFSGKRTFIDGGVYIRFNGGVGSRVIIFSAFMWFCTFLWTSMFLLVLGVSKDSGRQEHVRFIVSRQYQTKSTHTHTHKHPMCILTRLLTVSQYIQASQEHSNSSHIYRKKLDVVLT